MCDNRKILAVVFDLDHTLFDRYATLSEIASEMLIDFSERLTVKSSSELSKLLVEADEKNIEYGFGKVYDYLCSYGVFKKTAKNEYSVSFEEYYDYLVDTQFLRHAVPYPFTKPMLEKLRSMGLKTGLITNGPGERGHERQMSKLKLLGIDDMFDEIIISCDVGFHKPDTRIFDVMTERLGISPEKMLYVGDHPINDVDASRRAGYIPVWVKLREAWTEDIPECKYSVKDISELPELVEKINSL